MQVACRIILVWIQFNVDVYIFDEKKAIQESEKISLTLHQQALRVW